MKRLRLLEAGLALLFCLSACAGLSVTDPVPQTPSVGGDGGEFSFSDVPAYDGEPYVLLGEGKAAFSEELFASESFETYAPLDELGRCGTALACIGRDLMPTEERGSIGQVKPTGWQTVKYDHVDGKYLYNRCHLIGFQLSGENANERNLITGTRAFNVDGMLPFENMVADYVKETDGHVLYRVTPHFEGEELVARGVVIEACSVEDAGAGINFRVYCYNVQPRVSIDYATGESRESGAAEKDAATDEARTYVLNLSSHKFHLPTCAGAAAIKAENRAQRTAKRSELLAEGYEPCGSCKP